MTLEIAVDAPDEILAKLEQLSSNTRFEKQSSKGANGYLFFGTNLVSEQRVAIKFYPWAGDHKYHAEPRRLASLDSPNIARVLDAGVVDDEWAFFATPYYEHGDLDDEIGKEEPGNFRAIDITRSLLNGISHLHEMRLVHRDLKPQNIFLADDGTPAIGDFGSVKLLPDGESYVPGSAHSLLYRPPESVHSAQYGRSGDLYQAGLILFQLLGGRLPYEESAWLSEREFLHYESIQNRADKSIFVDGIIKRRIVQGRIVNLDSLPPWVPVEMRRLIGKACHRDPATRFKSCAEFHGQIALVRRGLSDWQVIEGHPTRRNGVDFRVVRQSGDTCRIQKRRHGPWRNDNSISGANFEDAVRQIELQCR